MRVLITGAEGYIGRVVMATLRERFNSNLRLETADLRRGQDIGSISQQYYDCLVHLAAFVRVGEGEELPTRYYNNNCTKYIKLLQQNQFRRIIYISSAAIYGKNSICPPNVYGSTKLDGEFITARARVPNLILRLGNPIGMMDYHQPIIREMMTSPYASVAMKLAEAAISNKTFHIHRNPRMTRDFFYVAHLAEFISEAIFSCQTGTFDVGSGQPVPVNDLLEKCCTRLGINYDYIEPPAGYTDNNYRNAELLVRRAPNGYDDFCEVFNDYIVNCQAVLTSSAK